MDDIESAISCAWNEIAPRLLADPAELARRLARRQLKHCARPLRAWCVAIRSNDHRIHDASAIIIPRTALSLDASAHPGRYAEHTVQLTKDLLVRLSEPVEIGSPGEPADEVAKRLGCFPTGLTTLRQNGTLHTTPQPGLRGRHGPPVPVIYTPKYLHPQTRGRAVPDEVFASCWRHPPQMLVDGFTQTLTRIPRYQGIRGRECFVGWQWICPSCRQTARTLLCPVDQPDFPTWIGFAPARAVPLPKPVSIFACDKCHGVLHFSRASLKLSWNLLILRYTGGLLYGHEVQMPDWLQPGRKRGHPARPRHSPRRDQVERLLINTDLSYTQIAARLHTTYAAAALAARSVYKRHNVRNCNQLRDLLRPAHFQAAAAPRAAG